MNANNDDYIKKGCEAVVMMMYLCSQQKSLSTPCAVLVIGCLRLQLQIASTIIIS